MDECDIGQSRVGKVCNPLTHKWNNQNSQAVKRLLSQGTFVSEGASDAPVLKYDNRPEYVKFYDDTQDPLIYSNIIYDENNNDSTFVDIQCLCFTGGGAKGLVYAGVLKALESRKILANLNNLGGSSAGAITACLVGTLAGLQSDIIRHQRLNGLLEIITETNFEMFYDSDGTIGRLLPKLEDVYNPFGLESKIDAIVVSPLGIPLGAATETLKSVYNAFRGLFVIAKDAKALIKTGGVFTGETFLWWMRNTLNEFLGLPSYDESLRKVTFADYWEMTGVSLTITATQINGTKTVYFGPDSTPNVEVALAVRASMSLPGIFASVEIITEDDGSNQYVDGGTYDNYPLSSFDVYDLQADLKAWDIKTAGFVLKSYGDKYGSHIATKDISVGSRLGTLASLHDVLHQNRRVGHHFWLRTCFLDIFAEPDEIDQLAREISSEYQLTEDDREAIAKEISEKKVISISTTEFAIPEYKKHLMIRKSYNQTLAYIDWVHERMKKLHKGYPRKNFMYSSKYREIVLIPELYSLALDTNCSQNADNFTRIDNLTDKFYVYPARLDLPDHFEGMSDEQIKQNMNKYEKMLDEAYFEGIPIQPTEHQSPPTEHHSSTKKHQSLPPKHQSSTKKYQSPIKKDRSPIKKDRSPPIKDILDSISVIGENISDIHLSESEIKKNKIILAEYLKDKYLSKYNIYLTKYRAMSQRLGIKSKFDHFGHIKNTLST